MARIFLAVRAAGADGNWQARWIDVQTTGAGHVDTVGALPRGSREAWHVLAYEGLPDFGPHPDINELLAYLDAVEDYGEAFEKLWACKRFAGVLQGADAFADAYQGTYPDLGMWARHYLLLLGELPPPGSGFDATAYARKAEFKGEVHFIPASSGGVHAFWWD
jgi:hypothetical protein